MPLIYGHRGASAAAPENTVAAFRLAKELGADGVELDVRRSADDHLVICHDPLLADGRAVRATARAQLPPAVPTLAEALDACAGMIVNIEIKNIPGEPDFDATCGIVEAVVALLTDRDRDDVIVSSFHLATIDRVKSLDRSVRTGLLTFFDPLPADSLAVIVERGHDAVHPNDWTVDDSLVIEAHRVGLEVNVWTVDDPDRMVTLASFGVDGVVTDVPDVARRVLRPA